MDLKRLLHNAKLEDQKAVNSGSKEKYSEVSKKNVALLKKIISEVGWPKESEDSFNAWLIAQHADHDINFQIRCLGFMLDCEDEENQENCRYLIDRILINLGEEQIYGTQNVV